MVVRSAPSPAYRSTDQVHDLIPLVFAEKGTGRRALRALYPLIGEDAPTTEIHVAMEGTWEGHPSGPFSLTRDDFAQIVRNFEASPNPIPLDYEHATEWADRAPACGWVQALEVREDSDGAHLWATVELGDEAAEFIRQGAYRFSSGVFVFDSVDHVSGEEVGTELTSLALTNVPFVLGQTPIQLSRRAARRAATETKRICMQKLTKEALLAALDQFEGDEIDMEQLEAAAQLAAVKEGGADEEPEAPEAPASDDPAEPEVPATDEPAEATEASAEDPDAVPAGDEPAGDTVPAAEDMPSGDQAAAALASLAEAAGLSIEETAAALMERRDEVAAMLGGGAEEAPAGSAPLSDREAQLALSARDHTIRRLSQRVDELEEYRSKREHDDAHAWACSLRDDGKILDSDLDDWKSLRMESPDRAAKLASNLASVVPTSRHATAIEPSTEGSDAVDIPEDDQLVKDMRDAFRTLGGKWRNKKVQDDAIRKALSSRKDPARADA